MMSRINHLKITILWKLSHPLNDCTIDVDKCIIKYITGSFNSFIQVEFSNRTALIMKEI